jgi:CRISPR-associated endonuclease/helicase Cas3
MPNGIGRNLGELQSSYRYWGKTRESGGYHLLIYHSMDVAAVGAAFLEANPMILARIAAMLDLDQRVCRQYTLLFLLLHDMGKFARQFQNLQPDLFRSLQGVQVETAYLRHDILGALCWSKILRPYCVEHRLLGLAPGVGRRVEEKAPVDYWVRTAVGHHGRPVESRDAGGMPLKNYFEERDQQAVLAFFQACCRLLDCCAAQALPERARVKRASWWLSGFTIACDWLGSHEDYFEAKADYQSIEDYWREAQQRAGHAVRMSGLVQSLPSTPMDFRALFGEKYRQLTPLQQACADLPVSDGPIMVLLEDVTGAGKTEAALMLAHRLITSDGARGIYFALPTMATANAMFARMSPFYRKLYLDRSEPSLTLAHGARKLQEGFRDLVLGTRGRVDESYGDKTSTAQALCKYWLADHPKKALLADVGVGTVDQAVLGVLPSTHQGMRLLGLLGKVLVVDEVHAYDAYLFNLLKALIVFHLSSGGSVILLSATLPFKQRKALLDIYEVATNTVLDVPQQAGSQDYPLLTYAGADGLVECVLESRKAVCRSVGLERIDDPAQVEAILEDVVRQGRCACWIRNSVGDARESYRKLKASHPDWSLTLFHARFALKDRLDIEGDVLKGFGDRSGTAQRQGRILIATPVVEQSLDLDFDLMISDLAPIDLIIQRAGRLCRHSRDVQGNPIEGRDQRGEPRLYLFAPDAVEQPEADWFSSFLPRAAKIYEDHARLWLGLRLLMKQGRLSMPDDARWLIEGVYGDVDIPDGLMQRHDESEGNRKGMADLANYSALALQSYYGDKEGGRWWDEARTPTRLGDSVTLYLARWDGSAIIPWCEDDDFPWQASTVSVLAEYLDDGIKPEEIPQELYDEIIESLPGKGRWGRLVVLCESDVQGSWFGVASKEKKGEVSLRYKSNEGLLVGEKEYEEP